jgi:hypothetical protein
VLKWLRANACPWDRYTLQHAEQQGHVHVADWVRANGCPEQ